MALELGELVVEIDARTKELQSGLRAANRKLGRFDKKATKTTRSVAKSFAAMGAGIGAVGAAISALGVGMAAFAAVGFAKSAVAESAAIESLNIRLEVLTGTTTGAAQAMADIKQLVTETPYGLKELGNAASSVAVIFGENTAAVSEFTGIAADLAAAFGKPVEQIGENLTRAFSSGLGAADALREAGISAEILKITGETDVAKISSEQLAEALRIMTEEGGKAFEAAAKRAESLEGAISNTGIAVDLMKAALGDALSPAIVSAGINVLQPFFQDLQKTIEENEMAITNWAIDAMPMAIEAIVWLMKTFQKMVKVVGWVVKGWKYLKAILSILQVAVMELLVPIRLLITTIKNMSAMAFAAGKAIVGLATRDLDMMTEAVEDAKGAVGSWIEDAKSAISDVVVAGDLTADLFKEAGEEGLGAFDAISDGIDAATGKLNKFNEEMREMASKTKEEATIARVNRQLDAAFMRLDKEFGAATGGRADLGDALKRGGEDEYDVDWDVVSPEDEIDQMVDDAYDAFEKASEKRDWGIGIATSLGEGITGAFEGAFREGEMDWSGLVQGLGPVVGDTVSKALAEADMGGFGEALGGAASAAIGMAMTLIAGSIGGTKKRQTFADIQQASAVTETQQVRGIVAGPQNIAIAEVGGAIADAFIEPTSILRDSLITQQGILAALAGRGGGGMTGSDATSMLESSPTLY